jgi:hypothetical protein
MLETILLALGLLYITFLREKAKRLEAAADSYLKLWRESLTFNNRQKRGYIHMALVLTDDQKVSLALSPKTASGNPASLDGPPNWALSAEGVVELLVAEDGLSAVISTVGLGSVQVTVTADADLDEDEVREISGVLDVLVVAGEAATLGISAGIPEVK